MKSLYLGVLLAMAGTLLLSLAVFMTISNHVQRKYLYPVFEAMDELELESARGALDQGGPAAVSTYMERLNHVFTGSHYLLDARGVDVVSGQNRSALLPPAPSRESRGYVNDRLIVTRESTDGHYWVVAVDPRQPNRWTLFPYYLLVISATGILCWLAAVGVVSPIRKMTTTVDRFGKGDLSARVNLQRHDEIGDLARSFNGMADRLQTLVVSERRLLEDISHELRSPLTRLKFALRLARAAADPNTAFDRVQREVDRITSLVSEIVELTRIEGDPLAQKNEVLSIGEILNETVSECRFEAEIRGCSIQLQGHLSGQVSGDRELLRRVIENVLRNAIRYSPQKAVVDVVLTQSAKTATITIRDYGPGVPAEALSRIFKPFFRVEEARDAESGGMGLGLSIAKRAVKLHHGEITAQNVGPGLRVQIVIPLIEGIDFSAST
jgi:signal transduction histidine kinase